MVVRPEGIPAQTICQLGGVRVDAMRVSPSLIEVRLPAVLLDYAEPVRKCAGWTNGAESEELTMPGWLKPSIHWLLAFIPVTLLLEHGGASPPLVFFSAALSIVPIAALIVHSTEQLAVHTGDAVGGLLNATFGNAPELIIAFVALRSGLVDLVRGSLVGAIFANILLALGLAFLLGGLRFREQVFNANATRMYSSLMFVAVVSLAIPSALGRRLAAAETPVSLPWLNLGTAVILLAAYVLYLVFMLKTHPNVFKAEDTGEADPHATEKAWSVPRAVGMLLVASVGAAFMSEILVGRGRGHRGGARHVAGVHRLHLPRHRRRRGGERLGHRHGAQEPHGSRRRHRAGQLHPDRAVRGAGAGHRELLHRAASPSISPSARVRSRRCSWPC